ncbi:MAG: winged helix-turn-helix domain-containing protein [Candidatus Geothermarchaeales archaeon]
MKYRPTVSILLAILETIHSSKGANISQISTHANISHARLKVKLDEMASAGLVAQTNSPRESGRFFTLTDKGRQALFTLRELTSFLSSLGLLRQDET